MDYILIRGMKFPDKCGNCRFATAFNCEVTNSFISTHSIRQPDCPLIGIPKHGRLIDADALLQEHERVVDSWGKAHIVSAQAIRNAPTVIEAEEET